MPALSRDAILDLQRSLNERGFDSGKPDGIIGSGTRSAIRKYQSASGLVADGYPGQAVLDKLGITTNR